MQVVDLRNNIVETKNILWYLAAYPIANQFHQFWHMCVFNLHRAAVKNIVLLWQWTKGNPLSSWELTCVIIMFYPRVRLHAASHSAECRERWFYFRLPRKHQTLVRFKPGNVGTIKMIFFSILQTCIINGATRPRFNVSFCDDKTRVTV